MILARMRRGKEQTGHFAYEEVSLLYARFHRGYASALQRGNERVSIKRAARDPPLLDRNRNIMFHKPHPPFVRSTIQQLYLWASLPVIVLLSTLPVARAEETMGVPTEEAFLGELPVVLSATRLAQPLAESPASITVIDRELIEASGAVDIPDVLRLVPGVQVGHADGTHLIVTYHGLSDVHARRLQVLVDGRSVYSPDFGRVLWSDLPLFIEDIERIEFIRGPNGVTFGANSFVGVINIITRHPSQVQGTYLEGTYGERRMRRWLARHAGGSDSDLSYRVSLGYRTDDGFPQIKDDKHVALLTYRGEYRASRRDTLDIQFGVNDNTRGTGSGADENPMRDLEATSHYQYLRWRRAISPEEEWSLLFYHNYQRLFDTYQTALISDILDIPPALVPVLFGVPDQRLVFNEDVWAERYDLELQHVRTPARDMRLVWGAETRLDRVRGPGWLSTPDWQESKLARLFANTEWRIAPRWILNVGFMYEHNTITGGDLSPRLALNHTLAEGHSLRASISRAWRTPSVFERHANTLVRAGDGTVLNRMYVNGGSLRPERITAYELGYLGEFSVARATVDLKLYSEEIRDVIVGAVDASTADNYITFCNDGKADTYGWELHLQWRPTPATRLVAATAYAHVRGRYLERFTATTRTEKDAAKLTPVHTQSALLIRHLPFGLVGSLGYYKVGNMEFDNNDATRGYDNLELRLGYRLRAGATRGEIAVLGQHLAGDYFDAERDAVFDERFFVTLSLEF